MNNYKTLIIGDFHLNKTKYIVFTDDLTVDPNCKWVCSKWASIKTARKEYFKYKRDFDTPNIVVLQVGNNDLTKVSSQNCIITSLLRLANLLHKEGVKAVVLFSLVERASPVGPYNEQVKEINRVLQCKANNIEWLFFFHLWDLTRKSGLSSLVQGYQLLDIEHLRVAKVLQSIPTLKQISDFLEKDSEVLQEEKGTSHISKLPHPHGIRSVPVVSKETTTVQKHDLFLPEIERLKGKLNLMAKEKTKTEEYLAKLMHNISSMDEYVVRLQKITQ